MRLFIQGSVVNQGRHASFASPVEDLASIKGKKIPLAVNDLFLQIDEVFPGGVSFQIFYFDAPHPYRLSFGESASFRKEGNAFVLNLSFSLIQTAIVSLSGELYRTSGSARPYAKFENRFEIASGEEKAFDLEGPDSHLLAKREGEHIALEVIFGESKEPVVIRIGDGYAYRGQNGPVGMDIAFTATK